METLDQLFGILSKERRRYALYALDQADGPVGIEELANQIRRWEEAERGIATEEFEKIVLSLKHTHLPKASRAKYIEYDRDQNEIRISGDPTELQIILTVSEAIEKPEEGRIFDPDALSPEEFLAQFSPAGQSSD